VGLRLFMFAGLVEVGGLIMVMGSGLMMGRRFVMMLARRMLGVCHSAVSFCLFGEKHVPCASKWRRFLASIFARTLVGRRGYYFRRL
jgi:hypothetical protein